MPKNDINASGKNLCIHYGELFTKYSEVINEIISSTDVDDGVFSKSNDVLMPTSDITPNGLAKASCLKMDGVILGGDILIIRPNHEIYGEFLSRFIRFREREVLKLVSGTTVYHLYSSAFGKFRVVLPQKKEQEKIAACLSSLDEVITAHSQKLEALKTHKKGLMQKLFPQEGEKVPKLRFKEFVKDGVWEIAALGEKNIAEFVNERMPLEQLKLDTYVSTENMLSEYKGVSLSLKLPTSGSFTRFKKGDILISNIRPYLKKVWYSIIDGAASNDIIVIRTDSVVLELFLSFLLRNDNFINFIMKGAEGVKMPRGDKDLIKEYPIIFPEKEEQKKIANCLTILDELVTSQFEKIEQLKFHKKALMQGLFPKTSEL